MLLENSMNADGLRVLRVAAPVPVMDGWLDYVPDAAKDLVKIKRWQAVNNMHHLEAKWPAREMVPWQLLSKPFPLVRQLGMWFIGTGKVSKAIQDAAVVYALGLGIDPTFAWLRTIPQGASDGFEMGQIMLIQEDWVPVGFVAVGRGGDLVGQVPRYVRPNPPVPSVADVEQALSRHRVDKAMVGRLL